MYLKTKQRHLIIFFLTSVNKEVIKKQNKYLNSTLEIPAVNSGNPKIDDMINQRIKDDILNFYEESLKEAQSFLEDFELDESRFIADASFEVKKNTSNIISIFVKYYKYSGGAHGYYEYIPYNFDLRSGKNLTLKEIFKQGVDYKIIINNEIEKQIKELGKKEKDLDKVYDFYGIKENQKFYLEDGNIVIYFDLYDIAPYAAGIPEFPIIVENIKNHISEDYLDLVI